MKIKYIYIHVVCIFFIITQQTSGQGWERTYGGTKYDYGSSVQQTKDGGYIIAGSTSSFGVGSSDVYLIKTDANGDTLWTKTFGGTKDDYGSSVQQTSDGGYIITGQIKTVSTFYGDVYLVKTDINGDTLWTKTYGGTKDDNGYSVHQTTDEGYIIAGLTKSFGAGSADVYLIKTDNNGDTLWTNTFGGSREDYGYALHQTSDGGFIIAGYTESFGKGSGDIYLIKTNTYGDSLWTKTFGGINQDRGYSVQQTADKGYILAGSTESFGAGSIDVYLIKTNVNGDSIWSKTFGGTGIDCAPSVHQTSDGGYVFSGNFDSFGADSSTEFLIKTNVNGDFLWSKSFGQTKYYYGYCLQKTSDGGYVIVGMTKSLSTFYDIYLVKTDSLGNTVTNTISGNIFIDPNMSCSLDTNENALKGWLVKSKSEFTKYATTNSDGAYSFLVDSGIYSVSQVIQNPYFNQTCPGGNSYLINFSTNSYDTSSNNNFGNQIAIYCPLMWVDVSTGLVRPCRKNTYTVNCCNNGTIDANNAYVEVEFPNKIIPLSSTPITWSSVNANVYRFDLGTVQAGQCGTFYITDSVACDAQMNSTVCVKAKIYPDTICIPVDPGWDKSSIVVKGDCIGDSIIRFVILNAGVTMNGTSEYRIYINNAISQTQNFQLQGGDSLIIEIKTNGNTIRLEADQRPNHPGKSHPRVTIEGCGFSIAPPVLGLVNQVGQDDQNDFVDITCNVIRASYDPNEKLVSPEGITSQRYIGSKDDLEYQINFQNTGNDTAFLIVVRDTLPASLEVPSVVSGAGSHPYIFRIYGAGILEWTFRNILLPDSNVNEPASHGFVKFKVEQKSGNPRGEQILNRAGIYFDYNAPVVTNPVWVRVQDTTIITFVKADIKTKKNPLKVSIIPNPSSRDAQLCVSINVEIIDTENSNYSINIYDVLGQLVFQKTNLSKQTTLSPNLPAGVYIYYVRSHENGEVSGMGKLAVE